MNDSEKRTTYKYIIEKINNEGTLHFSLIDPDPIRQSPKKAAMMAKYCEDAGTDAILVGGSTAFSQAFVTQTIELMRDKIEHIPIIIFPGGISCVSNKADAILFMSLLNSRDPYFLPIFKDVNDWIIVTIKGNLTSISKNNNSSIAPKKNI